jgi:hypothetical protein
MDMGHWYSDASKPKYLKKTLSATFSTINFTRTPLGSMSGLRGEKPATNRLSSGIVAAGERKRLEGIFDKLTHSLSSIISTL